jgi:hypothetical protein
MPSYVLTMGTACVLQAQVQTWLDDFHDALAAPVGKTNQSF